MAGGVRRAVWGGVGIALLSLAFFRQEIDDTTTEPASADAGVSAPRLTHPALALLTEEDSIPVALTGSGFGGPDPSTRLEVLLDGSWVPIESTASCPALADQWCIVVWTDEEIVAKLPGWAHGCRLRVQTPQGTSEVVPAYEYAYDWFETNADWCRSEGTNPHPVAVAVDASGRVWINEEFHTEFKMFDPASGVVSSFPIGHPAEGPFASDLFGDHATPISRGGEDIVVDRRGRVWLSEGGCGWCDSVHPDHSRIVMHDPASGETRVYNLPGNANGASGLAYEADYAPGRDRVWFTQLSRGKRGVGISWAKLVWFDPERAPFDDGTFDFAVDPAEGCGEKTCPASLESCEADADCRPACESDECPDTTACGTDDECLTCCLDPGVCPGLWRCRDATARACLADWQCQPVCGPGACRAAGDRRCFADADCALSDQVCAANGDTPECLYHEYELPGVLLAAHVAVAHDRSVWFTGYWAENNFGRLDPRTGTVDMFPLSPPRCQVPDVVWLGSAPWEITVAPDGDVILGEYGDSTISRFDIRRLDDPACRHLEGGVFNDCISELDIPAVSLQSQVLHSLAFDHRGNLWFTQGGPPNDPLATTTLGYVKRDWSAIVLLPGLSMFPFVLATGATPSPDTAGRAALPQAPAGAVLESDPSCFAHPGGLRTPGARLADLCASPVQDSSIEQQEDGQPPSFCSFEGTGIAVDHLTGDIWFGDYCRKRLGRLRPVRTNLGLGQPATQSSTYGDHNAGRAVDGNVDGDATRGSVAETTEQFGSWWEVDLGDLWWIEQIEISNRTDCCADGLKDFYVLASDVPFRSADLAETLAQPGVTARHHDGPAGRSTWIDLGRSGRYVRVQLAGPGKLALAEVVVLGGPMPECGAATAASDCDDGNNCTADICRYGRCEPRCRVGAESGSTDGSRCVANRASCACASCAGDCNCDGEVRVDDLLLGVRISLGMLTPAGCPSLDGDGDDQVLVHELIAAVGQALAGCPAAPTPAAAFAGSRTGRRG